MNKKTYFFFQGLLFLCATVFLGGCSKVVLFDPKGPIGESERFLILLAIGLMLIVVLPVHVMAFLFSRRYRASNPGATYTPQWSYSVKIDLVIWLVPVAIVMALGVLAWRESHRLNPYRPIYSSIKPIRIEAVSLDWKWLFIYPDHNIATVNQLVFPAKVPLSFRITSDTVMTSFFIPQLGSQIYAMAGMQTRLHLMAEEAGVYWGQNQQFSGRGFADMNFRAIALSGEEFQGWLQRARESPDTLDLARFEDLEKPTVGYPVTFFSEIKLDLFDYIIRKYIPSMKAGPGRKGSPGYTETGRQEGN
jgi:cytochrome o ubiquinol oxidase subunit 2